jgi:hypothetical protein
MVEPMTTAGYSGAPLARKLGIKPEHDVVLVGQPEGWEIPDLPAGVTVSHDALQVGDVQIAFFRSLHELEGAADDLVAQLPADSALWIAWPRRAGGHTSDITENDLRRVLLPAGVVDTKVAALDNDWSGLKFVWRKEHRGRRAKA